MKAKVDKELDRVWALLVKHKAGWKCEVCGKRRKKYLNSHHIFTRQNKSVRWDLKNGIALCPLCHTLSSKFSAHGTPITFTDWLRKYKGNEFVDLLTLKSNTPSKLFKFEKKLLLQELKKELVEYDKKN